MSAPEHITDMIQKPADRKKKKIYTFQNFNFTYIIKNVLVKTQKPQLCYYPEVKLSVFQA